MVITFIILWILTILLLVIDGKTVSTRWAALITFCGGCGGFARAWVETFMPYLREYRLNTQILEQISGPLYNIGSFTNTNGLPYAFLMFSLYYANVLTKPHLRWISGITSVPALVMLWVTPFSPVVQHNYRLLLTWVGPYILIGTGLLIYSYMKESNPIQRKPRMSVIFLVLPPVLFQLFSNYILRAFDIHQAWRLNTITVTALLAVFSVLLFKRGLFGIKLKIERVRMGSTLKTLTSGTALLQHTIKNEAGKIDILANKVLHSTDILPLSGIEDIKHIQSSARHLLHMVERIQHNAQEIVLVEKQILLRDLISDAVTSVSPHLQNKAIDIKQSIPDHIALICDSVHMKEVIHNILSNSIEAIQTKGYITIIAEAENKEILISIQDNGPGISKENIKYVFDPFFTTKKLHSNYGLGLTYCYKVAVAHGGLLTIDSEEGKGTLVQINWPRLKTVTLSKYRVEGIHEVSGHIAG